MGKINIKKITGTKPVKFSSLHTGDVFEFCNDFYIRTYTLNLALGGMIDAVRLSTGDAMHFKDKDAIVYPVKLNCT